MDIDSKMLKVTRAYEERIDELLEENTRLRAALEEVMGWISEWSPSFTEDEEWIGTRKRARAALTAQPAEGEKHE